MAVPTANPISKSQVLEILEIESRLIELARRFDLRLQPSAPSLGARLMTLTPEFFTAVKNNLLNLTGNFNLCLEEDIDPWDDKEFFRISMQSLGLTYPKDFLNYVERGDLVEGYDMNRFQVFRNMRFMEMSTYSLTEILSFDWPTLFDRPSTITDKMISYCDEILWTANRTIPFDIPPHFVRELRSNDRQVCEITFKYLAPLFSGPDKPYGLLGTCGARTVQKQTTLQDNLSFL